MEQVQLSYADLRRDLDAVRTEIVEAKREIRAAVEEGKMALTRTALAVKFDFAEMQSVHFPRAPSVGAKRRVWLELRALALNDAQNASTVVSTKTDSDRKTAHLLAEQFGFGHITNGYGNVLVFRRHGPGPLPELKPEWDADDKMYFNLLKRFVASNKETMNFPASLTSQQRAKVHTIAELFGLDHDVFGSSKTHDRYIRITKVDPTIAAWRAKRVGSLKTALEGENISKVIRGIDDSDDEAGAAVGASSTMSLLPSNNHLNESNAALVPSMSVITGGLHVPPAPDCMSAASSPRLAPRTCTEKCHGSVRAVTWNVAWLDLRLDDDVECRRIAAVLKQLDPHLIAIQEGPSSVPRMEQFVRQYLDDRFTVLGGLEELKQQMYFLVLRDGPVHDAAIFDPVMALLSQPFQFDVNGDRVLQFVKFTRRPLVIRARVNGNDVFVCNVHMKSKKTDLRRRADSVSVSELDLDRFIEKSVKSRRRIGAECLRLRECLEQVIFRGFPNSMLLVLGDVNTGPGLGFFERFFLLFDSVDLLQGSPFNKTKRLYSILLNKTFINQADRWSAEFNDPLDKNKRKKVLVDHIFVNKPCKAVVKCAGIAHDVHEANGRPSDHVALYVDLF